MGWWECMVILDGIEATALEQLSECLHERGRSTARSGIQVLAGSDDNRAMSIVRRHRSCEF